jgi:lipopolysaccharide transport system ATP-binding protein
LNGSILGMSRRDIDRRFDEIVSFAEVEQFLDTPVKRFSSGMYVRLAFAVAAHLDPQILLLDEVLSVGDSAFQSKCLARMDDIRASGTTILFVSHNLQSVAELCQRCFVVSRGRIVFSGPPHEAIDHYYHALDDMAKQQAGPQIECAIEGRVILGGAKITRVRIVNSAGKPTNVLRPGDSFDCEMDVEFQDEATNPVPACFIESAAGQLVYDINTTWMAVKTGRFAPGGSHRFRWSMACHLLPGRYFLGVDLARADLMGYHDRKQYALPFEVVGNSGARGVANLSADLAIRDLETDETRKPTRAPLVKCAV